MGDAARAFTLLEILIVLSLLVLLALLAWPLMESQIRASDLPESAQRLRSTLIMARSTAVMEHRRVRVNFMTDEQQPVVEIEKDPIRLPGEWTAVTDAWTREPVMLGEVRVHRVAPGRPFFTRAVSKDADPSLLEEEVKNFFEPDEEESQFDAENPDAGISSQVYFEADGSCDWATIIVAEVEPEKDLDEETPQRWIVLDGRTGLARLQDQIREEQVADAEFYLDRDKLEFPETTAVEDLRLTVGGPETGATTGDDGLGSAGTPGGLTGGGTTATAGTLQGGAFSSGGPGGRFDRGGDGSGDRMGRRGPEDGEGPGRRRGGNGRGGEGDNRRDGNDGFRRGDRGADDAGDGGRRGPGRGMDGDTPNRKADSGPNAQNGPGGNPRRDEGVEPSDNPPRQRTPEEVADFDRKMRDAGIPDDEQEELRQMFLEGADIQFVVPGRP